MPQAAETSVARDDRRRAPFPSKLAGIFGIRASVASIALSVARLYGE